MEIEIREQRDDELGRMVDVINRSVPADAHLTEEQARIEEGLQLPEEPPMRLMAFNNEQPVGVGYCGRNLFSAKGRYRIGLAVVPEFRNRGIAHELYGRLIAFAENLRAEAVAAWVHEHNLPLVEAWLSREGYYEIERMRPSELNLKTFNPDRWADATDRVREQGIDLFTLGEVDNEDNRRKLWELNGVTHRDVPHDEAESDSLSFEAFDDLLNRPEAKPGCLVIAADKEEYVGFSLLVHQTSQQVLTGMTGVRRQYRNRGIALAMKVRSAQLAGAAGYTVMRTFNHVNNPAMLSVNDRLGYVALPNSILFRKDLQAA